MRLKSLIQILLLGCLLVVAVVQADEGSDFERGGSGGGLLGLILAPIRATLAGATRFLSHRVEDINDGVDTIRLQTYKIFLQLYNKTYSPEELPHRMALFFERRQLIEEAHKLFDEGKLLFSLRENSFVDWSQEELKALLGALLPRSEASTDHVVDNDDSNMTVKAEIPISKDWRTSGCVAAPMSQEKCGACYAIATVGVLETMRCLNKVSSPTLSPQQIVDCATRRAGYNNFGCNGGWPTQVLNYLQNTRTVARSSCYPYVRRQNSCKMRQMSAASGCTVSSSPTGSRLQYKVLHSERDILYHVATTGPVVTVLQASDKFLYYENGIFDDPHCSRRKNDVDHAVSIVGYGRERGIDYWLVKNSWGTTDWGIGGYGKVRRGKNACSIGYWGWVITA